MQASPRQGIIGWPTNVVDSAVNRRGRCQISAIPVRGWFRRRRGSRLHETARFGPPVDDEHLDRVVAALDRVAAETGRTVPQVALNWLIQRPTVSSVIIGARDEAQLRDNLGAIGWTLTAEQSAALDAASAVTAPYPHFPYYRQEGFARLNPPLVA